MGAVGELSTSNLGTEGADDANMGDEVAQRDMSDAESISGDEIREPRRRNSPSDPTSKEIEDHVLTGHAIFQSWCAACVQEQNRAERHEAAVEQRRDSPFLVMHDGVTKSIFARLIPSKGVDFPCCEKVVKMFIKGLDKFWGCDSEPSILALFRVVKLAWTCDVVQETSAEGDPQSNGAAECSVRVVKGHVRSIKLAVESAWGVEVPADHDLLTWLVPYAASMHRRFAVGRDCKTARKQCGQAHPSS